MSDTGKPTILNLVARLAAVKAAVSRIPKTGYNERQDYHYVTESDVMDCIRSNLAAQGVIIRNDVAEFASEWRDTRGGGAMQWVRVKVVFTAEADNGEKIDLGCMYGQGTDSGEKAIYKAVTGAVKYKLLKQFLMSSGDDPEAEKKPIHRERPEQRAPSAGSGSRPASNGAPTAFPNFGPAKGGLIRDAKPEYLETYLAAAKKSLADPSKAKWHAKESALIGAYEAEVKRQKEASGPVAGVPKDFAPYQQAVILGTKAGWLEDNVKHWLKTKRGKSGSATVTAEDVEALRVALEPPETKAGPKSRAKTAAESEPSDGELDARRYEEPPPPGDDDAPF